MLLMPSVDVFATRSTCLHQLAEGHILGDYLRFIARLAEAQHKLLRSLSMITLPDAKILAECKHYRIPPLSPAKWNRNMVWLMVLEDLIKIMAPESSEPARTKMMELLNKNYTWLESQANKLLSGQFPDIDLSHAPFIGAALQVYWTHLAQSLTPDQVAHPADANLCPVCGSNPLVSSVQIDGKARGVRYLHCMLCSCKWHAVRAKCSNCGNTEWIRFCNMGNKAIGVPTESCHDCQASVKTEQMKKDPNDKEYADSFTSIALDLLMGGEDISRIDS